MVFFDDVTDTNNPNSTNCINHVRPFSELATDLQNNTVARYNFIIPNLCNDMHNHTGCAHSDPIQNGDEWLANNVPAILNSQAYAEGGVLFITWDEGSGDNAGGGIASVLDKAFRFIAWDEGSGNDGPIGLIVLSPNARGGGYSNSIHYTHSSLLRTIQEIFGVTPFLGDAAQATDVSDLFAAFP
jgi:phospholipase C